MRGLILKFYFITLFLCSFQIAKAQYVYVCTGPGAEKYHFTPYCSGLNRCSGDIVKMKLSRAKRIYSGACRRCYGDYYYSNDYYDDDYYERQAKAEAKKRKEEEKKKLEKIDKLKKTLAFIPVTSEDSFYPMHVKTDWSKAELYNEFIYICGEDTIVESWKRYNAKCEAEEKERSNIIAEKQRKQEEVKQRGNFEYIGFVGSYAANSSLGFVLGTYINNINIEASFSKGLYNITDVYWYDPNGMINEIPQKYSQFILSAHIGYGIDLSRHIKIVPTIGVEHWISTNEDNRFDVPKQSYSTSIAPSLRMDLVLSKRVCLVLAPKYNFRIACGNVFDKLEESKSEISKWNKGIGCSVSVYLKL